MKKTFKLTAPNKMPERQADAVKHEIKKYIKRERRKPFPDNFDCWEFDCRIGATEETAVDINITEISSKIDLIASKGHETFFLEVLVRPSYRPKQVPKSED